MALVKVGWTACCRWMKASLPTQKAKLSSKINVLSMFLAQFYLLYISKDKGLIGNRECNPKVGGQGLRRRSKQITDDDELSLDKRKAISIQHKKEPVTPTSVNSQATR